MALNGPLGGMSIAIDRDRLHPKSNYYITVMHHCFTASSDAMSNNRLLAAARI
jgi:hypothetical protein